MPAPLHRVFGIRHHGPGSARSLLDALKHYRPDCVLIEGPPEADALLGLVADPGMSPPVALLSYVPTQPAKAAFHPYAEFSPEWQALLWAARNSVPVRHIDLALVHQLAKADEPSSDDGKKADEGAADPAIVPLDDAMTDPAPSSDLANVPTVPSVKRSAREASEEAWNQLCELAGFPDHEALWDRLVETRSDGPEGPLVLFEAVHDLMEELRAGEPALEIEEAQREACMRQHIRAALKEGRERIAVVCGAWHAPRLSNLALNKPAADAALLKGLPKVAVESTWVPWSHGRLASWSGYGAGVDAPGWYHHRFTRGPGHHDRWLTTVAHALREKGLDTSSAHVIEAVRLAQTLAVLRGHEEPSLADLAESVRTVLCEGDEQRWQLVRHDILTGEIQGKVPDSLPEPPLHRDLKAQQKRLRLAPEITSRSLDLDLRKPMDSERSHLLHRLNILDVHWGRLGHDRSRGQNTFHEVWELGWRPELALAMVEAAQHGTTVEAAAHHAILHQAQKAQNIGALAQLLHQALLAHLNAAIDPLAARLDAMAAGSTDIPALLDALVALAPTVRYGDVRRTDAVTLRRLVHHYATRATVGLPGATSGIADEVAEGLAPRLAEADREIRRLDEEQIGAWQAAVVSVAQSSSTHPLLAGRAARLLLACGHHSVEQTSLLLSQALSPGVAGEQVRWLEGFLAEGGPFLLHHPALLSGIDAWMGDLPGAVFEAVLPILRRAFTELTVPERWHVGERLAAQHAGHTSQVVTATDSDWDEACLDAIAPALIRLLAVQVQS